MQHVFKNKAVELCNYNSLMTDRIGNPGHLEDAQTIDGSPFANYLHINLSEFLSKRKTCQSNGSIIIY